MNTEGKTNCKQFNSDSWGGYERALPPEIEHHIGKDKTQRLERTNGIVRQQTGRWHRRQNKNKFGKVWEQTKVTTRLVVSYFNWIWRHSRFKSTAAQRAGLTTRSWTWHDIVTYLRSCTSLNKGLPKEQKAARKGVRKIIGRLWKPSLNTPKG